MGLLPAYLQTLSSGDHTLTAQFDNGEAEAKFTVKEVDASGKDGDASGKSTPSTMPSTGDGHLASLVGMLALVALAVAASAFRSLTAASAHMTTRARSRQ